MMIVVDAKGKIAGRMATSVAKKLLAGEEVVVYNTKDVVFSGTLASYKDKMDRRRLQQNKRSPEEGPKYPHVPYMLFKKLVKGMLPKKSSRGREAIKRLKAYDGEAPAGTSGEPLALEANRADKPGMTKKSTLGDLCRAYGYDG